MKPDLNLNYNSRRMDGLLANTISDGEGFGWELNLPHIEWRGAYGDGGAYNWDNSLMLSANGASFRVIPTLTTTQAIGYR